MGRWSYAVLVSCAKFPKLSIVGWVYPMLLGSETCFFALRCMMGSESVELVYLIFKMQYVQLLSLSPWATLAVCMWLLPHCHWPGAKWKDSKVEFLTSSDQHWFLQAANDPHSSQPSRRIQHWYDHSPIWTYLEIQHGWHGANIRGLFTISDLFCVLCPEVVGNIHSWKKKKKIGVTEYHTYALYITPVIQISHPHTQHATFVTCYFAAEFDTQGCVFQKSVRSHFHVHSIQNWGEFRSGFQKFSIT